MPHIQPKLRTKGRCKHLFQERLDLGVGKFLGGSRLHDAVAEGRDQLGRSELAHVAVHQLHEGVFQGTLKHSVTLTDADK